jgi:gliding motility-associated protein GldM
MGTKNCPESPRQKMINMMYLVLTAMLALNVAAETLYAFKVVDESLMKTYLSFSDKNKVLVNDFSIQYDLNQERTEQWMNLAEEVHGESEDLISYIVDLKVLLAEASGALVKEPGKKLNPLYPLIITNEGDTIVLSKQDDLHASPQVMLTEGKGKELQDKVNLYRDKLIQIVNAHPQVTENLNSALDINDPERDEMSGSTINYRTWVQQNFESTPVIASIALLSKLQIDVRNAESAVLRHLYNQIDAESFKFTGLSAKVMPEASYIFQGQEYRARIFLSAEDSTQALEVYMDGSERPLPIDGNEAVFSITPTNTGEHKYSGHIRYRTPGGEGYGTKPFEMNFRVAAPAVTIAATRMNVLYRDLKNPVSVSVPGVPSANLEAYCTNGNMYKDGDNWIIEPAELDNLGEQTKVIVNANFNGEIKKMGEQTYRVMRVPEPRATVAGLSSGGIDREILRVQRAVMARLDDFYFDLRFEVTAFDMTVPAGGGMITTIPSNSFNFTDEQRRLLNNLGAGDRVSFENIRAKIEGGGPETERQLAPIILTVQ